MADPDQLQRYRFGSKSTEFMICRNCGAYAGAMVTDGQETWATLNLRLAGFTGPQRVVSYGTEDRTIRRARRRLQWTPLRLAEEPNL